jgi:hypothetical protein
VSQCGVEEFLDPSGYNPIVTSPAVELWVDDHQEYEPGVVHGHLRHARVAIDPHPGDYLVVGDDEDPPVLAEVLSREPSGELLLRLLPGRPESNSHFMNRRISTGV